MNIFRKNSRVLVWCHMNRSRATQIFLDGVDQVSMKSRSSDHVHLHAMTGTTLSGIRFRRALLDTIVDIGGENTTFTDYLFSVLVRCPSACRYTQSSKPEAPCTHATSFQVSSTPPAKG